MKKILFIFLLSLVVTAGYYIYTEYIRSTEVNSWSFIPSKAAIVIESNNISQTFDQLLSTELGNGLRKTGFYNDLDILSATIDSLANEEGSFNKILNNPIYIALVPTAQDQFDVLYVLPSNSVEFQEILTTIFKSVNNRSDFLITSRTYLDMEINEVKMKGSQRNLSFIYHKNHLILSRSAFVVESVLRIFKEKSESDFRSLNVGLFKQPALSNDAANIYVNYKQFSRLLSSFLNPSNEDFFHTLSNANGGAVLDFSFGTNSLVLNGFSISYDSTNLFPLHKNQSAGEISAVNLVPSNAEYLWSTHYTNKQFVKDSISMWLGNEMSLAALPSLREGVSSQILYIEAKDPGAALYYFNKLAERSTAADTIYQEYYAGYPLTEITAVEWPVKALEMYEMNGLNFFTIVNNFIVISPDIEALKLVIEDIENENTWGKTLELQKFLQLGLEEVNMSLIIHPDNYWRSLVYNVNDKWKNIFLDNESFFKGFILSSFQINRLEDDYYTTAILAYEPQEMLTDGERSLDPRFSKNFKAPLALQPYIVKSHVSNNFEILMQDVGNQLYLLDWNGNIIWQDSISSKIETEIRQIDFYNNDKLQYFFTGRNKVYIIDRNGNNVEDYPIEFGQRSIQFTGVIDYDNSKTYRFAVADDQGTVYLFDKHGKELWEPKRLQGSLGQEPIHVRIRAKDYILVIQARGVVHMFNRRGEYYPNFPISLEDRILGRMFLQKGTDAKSSLMHLVTENGQLIKINFEGKIVSKENLYRPTRESRFYLVPEVQGKTYIIVREGLNRISILNEKGERRFEKDYLSLDPIQVQYYNFGTGKEVIAITDEEQQFTYLYNEAGELINSRPINSAAPVAILYFNSSKKFHIFKAYNNTLSALIF